MKVSLTPFTKLAKDVTASYNKLPTDAYRKEGKVMIIDQGKAGVAGYTDDESLAVSPTSPVIVFGDHTQCFKFVEQPFVLGADGAKVLEVDTKVVDPLYFFHLVRTATFPDKGYSRYFKYLKKQSFPVPVDLDYQRRISALLSRAEGLIAHRKASLRLLDELVRSVFLEMFGDPVRNEKGWKVSTLGKYTEFLTSGSRGWAEHYAEEGDWFFRIQNVGRGEMLLNDVQRVKAPTTQEAERTRVQPGDLLMSITADLGRTAVVPDGTPTAYINQHLALIRLKGIDPLYVSHYFATPYGQAVIQKRNKSNVKAGLNFNDIKSFPLVVPSAAAQEEYSKTVFRIRALRGAMQTSLVNLEQLCGSLSQRAFKGELSVTTSASNESVGVTPTAIIVQ